MAGKAHRRYFVLMNPWEARVLVTGKLSDLELVQVGWRIVMVTRRWGRAYEIARILADRFGYILEWYLEDEKYNILVNKGKRL